MIRETAFPCPPSRLGFAVRHACQSSAYDLNRSRLEKVYTCARSLSPIRSPAVARADLLSRNISTIARDIYSSRVTTIFFYLYGIQHLDVPFLSRETCSTNTVIEIASRINTSLCESFRIRRVERLFNRR